MCFSWLFSQEGVLGSQRLSSYWGLWRWWFSWEHSCCTDKAWVWTASTHIKSWVQWNISVTPPLSVGERQVGSWRTLATQASQADPSRVCWGSVSECEWRARKEDWCPTCNLHTCRHAHVTNTHFDSVATTVIYTCRHLRVTPTQGQTLR